MKPMDNESNIKNKNLGTSGQNDQVSKAMGNRGKQKNPNQLVKLRFAISKHQSVTCEALDDRIVDVWEHYITSEFLDRRGIKIIDIKEQDYMWLRWNYRDFDLKRLIFLEYTDSVENNAKNASDRIKKDFCNELEFVYEETFWLDKNKFSVIGYPWDEPLDYCPAIDGY
ncbi:hypothetical protein V3H19_22605 [Vibrio parahaemolyticus]|uniref:hypothetical protein n=1 Tax=Vibrio parahaemolyticus TaxID=670 RepID=UPI003B67855E